MSNKIEIAKDFAKTIKSDKIKLMILFGSVARGDYRPDSDIDILVVSNYHSEIWPKISTIIADTVLEKGELLSVHVMSETMTVSKLGPGIMCKKSSENSWEAWSMPEFKEKS